MHEKRRKKKNKISIKEKMGEVLEIPKELVLDTGKLTIVGQKQLFLENHKGIVEYEDFRIKVNTREGIIQLEGNGMDIKEITSEDIMVTGEIYTIQFLKS
ncbi:MAG: sporulation protein YqfC [Deltaproteobacteria bacterium]